MARPLVALLIAAAALFAGCGGTDIAYTEVESPPADLPLPDGEIVVPEDTSATGEEDGNVRTGRATPTAGAVVGTTEDPTTTTTTPVDPGTTDPVVPAEPVTEEPVEPTTDDSGGAAPPTEEPVEPAEPTDDTGGAVAGGASDQFCADNPGAC